MTKYAHEMTAADWKRLDDRAARPGNGWSHETVDRRAVEVYGLRGSADYVIDHNSASEQSHRCSLCGDRGDGLDRTMVRVSGWHGQTQPDLQDIGWACWACAIYCANGECDPEGDCCRG